MQITSIQVLAAVAKGRRLHLGLSQAELAARAGVSRPWISMFESGKPTAELGLVLRLLESLGLEIEVRAPPPTEGPSRRDDVVDLDDLLRDYERP